MSRQDLLSTPQLLEFGPKVFTPNYRQLPVILTRGEGCHVWDSTGRRYLDLVGGIAVNVLGHAHPMIVEAVSRQARDLIHVSNLYYNEPAIRLAAELQRLSGFGGRVFFANCGATANEAAIKLARRYFRTVAKKDRYEFITMDHSFHGRTLAMTAATGQPKYQAGYEPLPEGFVYAPFNDLHAIASKISPKTAAVFLEPIQGEGGVVPAQDGFLRGLRELCDSHGILLVLDEVQTGMGRTGSFFAYEQEGIKPDIVTIAKGLGGGLPIGAMIAAPKVAEGFEPGAHATTFGGNPLVCAVALAVLEAIEVEGLLDNSRMIGEYLLDGLSAMRDDPKLEGVIRGVRGRGLMVGLELDGVDGRQVMMQCLQRGLLVSVAGANVIRFVPPLTVGKGHIQAALGVLSEVLGDVANERVQRK